MKRVVIVTISLWNNIRRRFSLSQLLIITHMLLVVWLVGSLSYTRYISEWNRGVESEVRVAKASMHATIRDLSKAVSQRNYVATSTSDALDSYDEIDNLMYFEVNAFSATDDSFKVAWVEGVDDVWNIDASFKDSEALEKRIQALNLKRATASESEKIIINESVGLLTNKKDELLSHVRLQNLFGNIYYIPDFSEHDYVLNTESCLLYIKMPLRGDIEGFTWAVFDATHLATFKIDALRLIVREAIIAVLFSIALIFWAARRIIQPIHRLAQSMEGDIDSIDVENIPERDRSDELGQLAQCYASLIKRIQSQMHGLRRQSLFDILTGVYSRFAYETQATLTLEHARNNNRWFGLIVIDIDNFKAYNDYYGHAQGDEALQAVAKAIRASINPHSDKVYRYGGEEFVVVCEKSSSTSVSMLAELIRKNVWLEKIAHPDNIGLGYVTCSVGISITEYTDTEPSLKSLFKKADFALYQAKHSGRNRVVTASATMCESSNTADFKKRYESESVE